MIDASLVPKHIVLSRKGFDLSAGGCASPILDGKMISLPIPEHNADQRKCACQHDHRCSEGHLTFGDLRSSACASEGNLIVSLVRELSGSKVRECDCVHLDPDLRVGLRKPEDVSLPIVFGQDGGSQTELRRLGLGDLFLFFGWFRRVHHPHDAYLYQRSAPNIHAIWGWLQIEGILDLTRPEQLDEARMLAPNHPHVAHPYGRKNNCLYVGRKSLAFNEGKRGAGAFSSFGLQLQLTCEHQDVTPSKVARTKWSLPPCFQTIEMSRVELQNPHKWNMENGRFLGTAADSYGQEFVFSTVKHEKEIADWLSRIFQEA
jgi:hypothetical protein